MEVEYRGRLRGLCSACGLAAGFSLNGRAGLTAGPPAPRPVRAGVGATFKIANRRQHCKNDFALTGPTSVFLPPAPKARALPVSGLGFYVPFGLDYEFRGKVLGGK